MKFGKLLAGAVEAMPREYRDMFLEYKLFKQHISLYDKGACRCAVQQELEGPTVEELSSYAGGPHSAAAQAFLRKLPCYTDPCGMCHRPVLHNRNQQAGPKSSITVQAFTFERLLHKQLCKINKFFNRSYQEYIATMNVS
jgi:predicted ribosome quality control (RQC) complex YloA/Tae2 family protein